MSDQKRVNVISKEIKDENGKIIQEGNTIMRVNRSYAAMLLQNDTHTTTSKSKLKSFLNKNAKLHKSVRTVKALGTNKKWKDKGNGKSYASVDTVKFIYTLTNFDKLKNRRFKKEFFTLMNDIDEPDKNIVDQTGQKVIVTEFPNF